MYYFSYLDDNTRIKQQFKKSVNSFRYSLETKIEKRFLFWKYIIWEEQSYTYGEWNGSNKPVYKSFDEMKEYLLRQIEYKNIKPIPLIK